MMIYNMIIYGEDGDCRCDINSENIDFEHGVILIKILKYLK